MKHLKNTIRFFIPVLLFAFCLTSCGDDDGSGDISGTYKITSITSASCDDPDENFNFDLSGDGCQMQGGIELCVTGTMTISSSANTFAVAFMVSVDGSEVSTTLNGNYSIDGNTITICDAGECESATISANSNEITIKVPTDEDGCIFTISGEK